MTTSAVLARFSSVVTGLERERHDTLVAGRLPALAELVADDIREVAALGELLHGVRAADQLAADEPLRDRRPAVELRQLLADPRIGKDVDRRDGRADRAQRLERAHRVPAPDEARRPFHEERDRLGGD